MHVLGKGKRYEVANYPNVTIPTNLDVAESAKGAFGSFYAALFDRTVAKTPRAVVTEYAWDAGSCDPCPAPPLTDSELVTLGADVLPSVSSESDLMDRDLLKALGADAGQKPSSRPSPASGPVPRRTYYGLRSSFVLTRLHARYTRDALGDDLVFKEAPPLVGGRERTSRERRARDVGGRRLRFRARDERVPGSLRRTSPVDRPDRLRGSGPQRVGRTAERHRQRGREASAGRRVCAARKRAACILLEDRRGDPRCRGGRCSAERCRHVRRARGASARCRRAGERRGPRRSPAARAARARRRRGPTQTGCSPASERSRWWRAVVRAGLGEGPACDEPSRPARRGGRRGRRGRRRCGVQRRLARCGAWWPRRGSCAGRRDGRAASDPGAVAARGRRRAPRTVAGAHRGRRCRRHPARQRRHARRRRGLRAVSLRRRIAVAQERARVRLVQQPRVSRGRRQAAQGPRREDEPLLRRVPRRGAPHRRRDAGEHRADRSARACRHHLQDVSLDRSGSLRRQRELGSRPLADPDPEGRRRRQHPPASRARRSRDAAQRGDVLLVPQGVPRRLAPATRITSSVRTTCRRGSARPSRAARARASTKKCPERTAAVVTCRAFRPRRAMPARRTAPSRRTSSSAVIRGSRRCRAMPSSSRRRRRSLWTASRWTLRGYVTRAARSELVGLRACGSSCAASMPSSTSRSATSTSVIVSPAA